MRVRIAVAVDEDGRWWCEGAWMYGDNDKRKKLDQWALNDPDGKGKSVKISFVEADIPLPEKAETVDGEVVAILP